LFWQPVGDSNAIVSVILELAKDLQKQKEDELSEILGTTRAPLSLAARYQLPPLPPPRAVTSKVGGNDFGLPCNLYFLHYRNCPPTLFLVMVTSFLD
jgi:hypothetical protein